MPIPDGATRVTYSIASGSVDQPLQVILPVELGGGDLEFVGEVIEEAMDLVLTRIRADRPGDNTLTISRIYDCTVPDTAWPAE
ncbi:hypothetical protein ACFW61_24415 [Streptomyces microflavus]|uniref:hypothetical protein n=1 Tax=Streptomyces microflavus TaxID=1919 RepID=UPI0036C1B533